MKLTSTQKANLLDIIALIAERDMPSNNTEARLLERCEGAMDQESVAWCLDVLFNEGVKGWLDDDCHPQTGERGYVLNARFDKGQETLDQLFARFNRRPKTVKGKEGRIDLRRDDEDPDDEWADIDEDDED